jgi:hypothetical protein
MKQQLTEIFHLQDKLNEGTTPQWQNVRTIDEFIRAIWTESAEAMECIPWKWWKKMEPNYENMQIEVVDIFHFLVSLLILDAGGVEKAINSKAADELLEGFNGSVLVKNRHDQIAIEIEFMINELFDGDFIEAAHKFGVLARAFFTFEEMYLLYIGKNTLNAIRQEYGYKQGSYQKVIKGKEDNQYLLEIVAKSKTRGELEETIKRDIAEMQTSQSHHKNEPTSEVAGETSQNVKVAEKIRS